MKKVFLILLTVMGTLQLQAQDKNFWIFLCFGQSNMAGQAPIEEQDMQVSDRYLSMATTDGADRKLGEWRKAVPPLCRADAHLGPADWFGRTLLDVVPENVRIGIVSVAVEGCTITFFDKDQNKPLIAKEERDWMNGILDQYGRDPYERLLSMAKKAAKDGVIKGILLHQGETDAYNDQWRKTLRKIYRDLQQELQFDSTAVPLLVGEVVRGEYGGICGHANPTINDIQNHYPNTYVVSSEGCMPSDDNLHFSSEGYRMLGKHYALRYLEVTDPELAKTCIQRLSASGQDRAHVATSSLKRDTKRNGTVLSVLATSPVVQVDVVSFSGQTVKTYAIGSTNEFELDMKELPKEKLVFVFQSEGGRATTDVDLSEVQDIVAEGETPVRLSSSYGFTEGPAVDAKGDIYFTDQPNNRIYRWDCMSGEITLFTDQSGRSNGMYFDEHGNLIACADMDNQLWSFDMNGRAKTLITNFGGRLLNGPNDVWISRDGGYYLTDPYFKRDYWTRDPARQQTVEGLYYLSPGGKQLVMLDSTLNQPNGIVGTPDGKHLFVAEAKANRILKYDILPDGNLTNRQVFADMGSDGMTIDDRGNVYLTGDGVTVFDKNGQKIAHFPIPEDWTSNVCFGGKERDILFITASKSVYTLKMLVHGV